MWVYYRETLKFLAVNEAAVRHYGYSPEEFHAMTIEDLHPSDRRGAGPGAPISAAIASFTCLHSEICQPPTLR